MSVWDNILAELVTSDASLASILAEIGTIDTAIAAIKSAIADEVPVGSTRITGIAAADITDTTPVDVIAAASVGAGFQLYIQKLIAVNKTAAETPVLTVNDTDAGDLGIIMPVGDPATVNQGMKVLDFGLNGVAVTEEKGIEAAATSATGDCRLIAIGYIKPTT